MDDPDPLHALSNKQYPLLQFLSEELKLPYNPDKSAEAKAGFGEFYEWAKVSGVKGLENLDYPAIFGQGLRGARAATEIGPFEVVLAVPQKILMMPRQIEAD